MTVYASHMVWIRSDTGTSLAAVDTLYTLDYSRGLNRPGWCDLTLPGDFDINLLAIDNRIDIYRKIHGIGESQNQWQASYFIRRRRYKTASSGEEAILVSGPGVLSILEERVVAYDAATNQAQKTGLADDMMAEIVRENLGSSATDSDRKLSPYLVIDGDNGQGPSLTKAFSRQQVLAVLQELSEATIIAGTPVYFDLEPDGKKFRFKTYLNQRGSDRSYETGKSPVVLSTQLGNMTEVELDEDFTDEKTVIYAAGQGLADDRDVVEVEDATRSAISVWGRRELMRPATHIAKGDIAALTADANATLRNNRPRVVFQAEYIPTDNTFYGRDVFFGDKLTARYRNQSYTVLVDAVRVMVGRHGEEQITARLRAEL